MKVLHIIKSLGRGGAEMLLPETLKLHNKQEFEFHYIYFLPWKNQMVSAIEGQGGIVTCMPAKNNIELLLKVKDIQQYITKHGIQLVHAHLPWAGIVARVVGRFSRIPIVYTEHNKQERYHFATRFMNLYTMNWLTQIIAVSKDVEQSIIKNKPHLQVSVQTILNGVNIERFAPNIFQRSLIRKQFNIPENSPVIGTIAVFRFQKRLDLWIEIASDIIKQIPDAHFIIVGDGPLKKKLEEKRLSLAIESRLHFAGLQTEVRPYLAAFDLYMMSSIFEGLPIALLEAMACGCPVISTSAGGIKEVIRHEKDGLLCDVHEPKKLIDGAMLLLQNDELRKQYALAGRLRVIEEFSLKKMVSELETVYRSHL